ncbi:unnamed protein product [Arctia plantaginis]|uniref:Uncharacterized protein n=1 Tax=Arctia plantaginis TaxID=874455 RepID=A0A8S0Z2X6_ARCPL|nr:unnamed protein product [Arctia plantaginis]CAB3254885.1 unnamed protein product [Arctia plantaginis]
MDDSDDETSSNSDGLDNASSYSIEDKEYDRRGYSGHLNLRRRLFTSTSQTVEADEGSSPLVSRATATSALKKVGANSKFESVRAKNVVSTEPFCHVKLDSIIQLKDSTKKLLCLLDDIQIKSKLKQPPTENNWRTAGLINPIPSSIDINSDVCTMAIKRLETQTQLLESIDIADEDDDCSVYKKLTRKCNCLTQHEYNDFVIHFNEQTKFFTNTSGEIIKNLRILKKFLYMGGNYTKHALMFLNEGLKDSSYAEKVEIIQGCAYTDICNIFEDISLVISCIAWPYKYDSYGDTVTQELAAAFLFKLAQVEEGRRYLKLTSKINNDIKKVFRLKGSRLDFNTVESLHATLDALDPNNSKENVNAAYYCRPDDEGFGTQTMSALQHYRRYMTMDEIFTHLDFLKKLSSESKGKKELTKWLLVLVMLFKDMLFEYNNSEMNILVTNILNNLLTKDMIAIKQSDLPKVMMVADIATEPIHKRDVSNQIPIPKKIERKTRRLKSCLRMSTKKNGKSQVIIVPREKCTH